MEKEEFLKLIAHEIDKRFYDDTGYDIWSLEAFQLGAEIAWQQYNDKKGIPNPNVVLDGLLWAIEELKFEK